MMFTVLCRSVEKGIEYQHEIEFTIGIWFFVSLFFAPFRIVWKLIFGDFFLVIKDGLEDPFGEKSATQKEVE